MKTILPRLLTAGLLLLAHSSLHAQSMVPSAMNYQGFLTDTNGDPVASAAPENRNVEFRVYSQASGGTALWGEAQTVTVFKGNFSVILGNGVALTGVPSGPTAFASVFTNATTPDLFFGITPQGGAEFAPRQKLLASAYALRARTAEQVNQTSGTSTFQALNLVNATASGTLSVSRSGDGRSNFLEVGAGVPNKEPNAGRIFYQGFSDGLDIKGAGSTLTQRKITLWAEGGTLFKGPVRFEEGYRQNISMWDANNGLGLQDGAFYMRTYDTFQWHHRGTHHNEGGNPGEGGTRLASLDLTGFHLLRGVFTGNGSGLTNINPSALPNNYNYLGMNGTGAVEFGRGVSKAENNGRILYDNSTLHITGGGTQANFSDRRIELHAQGGLTVHGSVRLPSGLIDRGSNHGVFMQSFEGSSSMGSQEWTTYFRCPVAASGEVGSFAWYRGGAHTNNQRQAGDGGTALAYLDGNGFAIMGGKLMLRNNASAEVEGDVLIGRNTTMNGWLEVKGRITQNYNYAYFARVGIWAKMGEGGGDQPYGIRVTHRVQASEFNATSDARLKVLEGRSDSAADLETLMGIEVADYTLKDQSSEGSRKFKKVVAQQVEAVFPQVVNHSRGVVPDIFVMAKAEAGFVSLEGMPNRNLAPGTKVRLIQASREALAEITEVTGDGFRVAEAITGDVFVYGREVDDLRTVDYEGLAMLNLSATQEIVRQLKAQQQAVEKERLERQKLEREVALLRNEASAQEKRLAALEEGISVLVGAASGAAAPVRAVKLSAK